MHSSGERCTEQRASRRRCRRGDTGAGVADDSVTGPCYADVRMDTEPQRLFTAIIEQESEMYVGLCPELDIASQGCSVEEALANLRDAVP